MLNSQVVKARLKQEIRLADYVDSDYCDGVEKELLEDALWIIVAYEKQIEKLGGNPNET